MDAGRRAAGGGEDVRQEWCVMERRARLAWRVLGSTCVWCLVPGAAGPPGPPPPWRFIGRYAFVIDVRYVVKRFLQDERTWFNRSA